MISAANMTFALAGDVLYIILDMLGDEKDYNSLFQCAISSRCFTEHSLAVLYKSVCLNGYNDVWHWVLISMTGCVILRQ